MFDPSELPVYEVEGDYEKGLWPYYRMNGTRVGLDTVLTHYSLWRETPEEVVEGFDVLSLEDARKVWSWYQTHVDDAEAYLLNGDITAHLEWQKPTPPGLRVQGLERLAKTAAQARARWLEKFGKPWPEGVR